MTAVDVDAIDAARCPGSGQRTLRGRLNERDRCHVCNRVAYVRMDGTAGIHFPPGKQPWRGGIERIDLPGEEWRPIPGWEDAYEVSNLGRAYRVKQHGFPRSGRVLRPATNRQGYLMVNLWRDGQKIQVGIHRLVLWAFIGPQEAGVVVRHLDGNSLNNTLPNLRYGSQSENEQDKILHGAHNHARKTECPYGHPYEGENLYVQPSTGGRKCRACKLRRSREYEARKRVAA